jgi:hypothetical protein
LDIDEHSIAARVHRSIRMATRRFTRVSARRLSFGRQLQFLNKSTMEELCDPGNTCWEGLVSGMISYMEAMETPECSSQLQEADDCGTESAEMKQREIDAHCASNMTETPYACVEMCCEQNSTMFPYFASGNCNCFSPDMMSMSQTQVDTACAYGASRPACISDQTEFDRCCNMEPKKTANL